MKNAVLFDLGGTLANYFERSEFPDILRQAIAEETDYILVTYQDRLTRFGFKTFPMYFIGSLSKLFLHEVEQK